MNPDDQAVMAASAGPRLAALADSFRRLTGRALTEAPTAGAFWRAPRAIVAHGLQADPIFFYGNRLALELFETPARDFIRLPSRLSAEPALRTERERLLARVTTDGFIDDYAGVRISAKGRRFRIEQAVVWTVTDADGAPVGQAAAFDHWTRLN
ncbi:MAG: MEKHLA domain-containing protein [Caulobacterales bacterium 32-69-10]|nr:MAG: MEKHLA domain-containing protein [Caulobacterales bacterium 32-69-10]